MHLPAQWLTTDIKDKMLERNRLEEFKGDGEQTLIHATKSLEIGFKSLFVMRR